MDLPCLQVQRCMKGAATANVLTWAAGYGVMRTEFGNDSTVREAIEARDTVRQNGMCFGNTTAEGGVRSAC